MSDFRHFTQNDFYATVRYVKQERNFMKKLLAISICLFVISLAPQNSSSQETLKDFNITGDFTYEKLTSLMNLLVVLDTLPKNEFQDYPPLLTIYDAFLEVVHIAKDIKEGISDYKGDISFMSSQSDNYYVKELTKISAEILMSSMLDDGLKEVEQKSTYSESYFYRILGFIQLSSNYLSRKSIEEYTLYDPRDILEKRELIIRKANALTKSFNVPTYLDFAGKIVMPHIKLDLSSMTRKQVEEYAQSCFTKKPLFLYAGDEGGKWYKLLYRSIINKRFIDNHPEIKLVTIGKRETIDQAYYFNNWIIWHLSDKKN